MNNVRMKPKTAIPAELIPRRCVHVINLCALRGSVGPLWDSIQEAIEARMAAVMATQLSTADCYERLDDTHYLVVTPMAEADQGAVIAVRAACEFLKSLNGSCDLSNVCIDVVDYLGEDGLDCTPIRLDRLAQLVDQAQVADVILPPHLRRNAPLHVDTATGTAPRGPLHVVHRFEAIWDAKHEAVTTYLCKAEKITYGPDESTVQFGELTLRERTNVELMGLMAGTNHLSRKVENGDRFLLGIPLSFDTMCSPYGRSEVMRTCRGLPRIYRQYLSFLLAGIPLGVSHSRLTDLAMALRPFGRVIATVAAGCRNFNAYEGHGFSALAFDLSAAADADSERTRSDIVYVAAAARNMKCGSMVLNVDSQEMLNVVHAADCQQIHGPIISLPAPEPRRMTRLPYSALVHRPAEASSEIWF